MNLYIFRIVYIDDFISFKQIDAESYDKAAQPLEDDPQVKAYECVYNSLRNK